MSDSPFFGFDASQPTGSPPTSRQPSTKIDSPPPKSTALTSVVVTGLEDYQIITINEIDEAMLVGDAP